MINLNHCSRTTNRKCHGYNICRVAELNDNNRAINEQQLFPNPAYMTIHPHTREREPIYDYANLPTQSIADHSGDVVNQEQVNVNGIIHCKKKKYCSLMKESAWL